MGVPAAQVDPEIKVKRQGFVTDTLKQFFETGGAINNILSHVAILINTLRL